MNYPDSFSEISPPAEILVPPYLRLLDTNEPHQSVQFYSGTHNYLALTGTEPYGERTAEDLKEQPLDLLPITYIGADYTLFDIPRDLHSLTAVSLGSGRQNVQELLPLYEHAGSVVAINALKYRIQGLKLSNMALLRESGLIVITPPFDFKPGKADKDRLTKHIEKSITDDLTPVFNEHNVKELARALFRGINYEQS